MELADLLHVDDETELFILHYVFVPRINKHLAEFADGWNGHKLSSERNTTPNQLWISGLHEIHGMANSTITREIWEPESDVRRKFLHSLTFVVPRGYLVYSVGRMCSPSLY